MLASAEIKRASNLMQPVDSPAPFMHEKSMIGNFSGEIKVANASVKAMSNGDYGFLCVFSLLFCLHLQAARVCFLFICFFVF